MSAPDPILASAIAALRESRREDAKRLALQCWQQSAQPRAAAILALLESEAGRLDEAFAWNERASARSPGDPAIETQGARLLVLRGDLGAACDRFASVLRRVPQAGKPWVDFAQAALACGRASDAYAMALAATRTDRSLAGALQALFDLLPCAPLEQQPDARPEPGDCGLVSVITCSIDDERYWMMRQSYERALAGWPHEFIRIPDAKSLAEGYTRGCAAARGTTAIFTHDDVEILPADFMYRLRRRLDECDILGVAGASRATGPGWTFAGRPYLHGCVIYPEREGYNVTVYSQVAPLAAGMRLMDGVFLAMPREVALAVGWDAVTCNGFHGYDVDFTLRAAQRGFRLAVACDLGVVHRSWGKFDEAWRAAAMRLMERHPELRGERGRETGCLSRVVPDAPSAVALIDRWALAGQS
jgi:tetratricopeptide (TPR) repeat protein